MQKPIHIVVTTTDYREDFYEFCIKHKIKVPDDSFRHISNWVYVMAVYRNREIIDWYTASSWDTWKHAPPQSIIMSSFDFKPFYLETFNNLQTNNMTYYNIAVLHWEKELVKPKIILAKSAESAQAKAIKLIPDNIDFDDCEVLVSRVF